MNFIIIFLSDLKPSKVNSPIDSKHDENPNVTFSSDVQVRNSKSQIVLIEDGIDILINEII